MPTPTLPRKNQIVTVRLPESETTPPGTFFTGLVATVSRANGEFSVVVQGRPWWFGPEEMAVAL